MELEKFYNYSIKCFLITRFNKSLKVSKLKIKVSAYFKKSNIGILAMLILNYLSVEKPNLIFQRNNKNLEPNPLGIYFTSKISFFKLVQWILLLLLGVVNKLTIYYILKLKNKIIFPLNNNFIDLFEFCTINNILKNDLFYFFLCFPLKNVTNYFSEILLRMFRIPLLVC